MEEENEEFKPKNKHANNEKKSGPLKFIIIFLILSLFTFYSYFTYGGSARLQIAMMGYPFSAYQTGLEELTHLKEKNVRQFYPIKNIPVESGDMGIILIKNHVIIKIGKYIGF